MVLHDMYFFLDYKTTWIYKCSVLYFSKYVPTWIHMIGCGKNSQRKMANFVSSCNNHFQLLEIHVQWRSAYWTLEYWKHPKYWTFSPVLDTNSRNYLFAQDFYSVVLSVTQWSVIDPKLLTWVNCRLNPPMAPCTCHTSQIAYSIPTLLFSDQHFFVKWDCVYKLILSFHIHPNPHGFWLVLT